MKICPDFATNSREEWRLSLFQSNLRKQIRKLPTILKSVKIIHYYSLLFIRVLSGDGHREGGRRPPLGPPVGRVAELRGRLPRRRPPRPSVIFERYHFSATSLQNLCNISQHFLKHRNVAIILVKISLTFEKTKRILQIRFSYEFWQRALTFIRTKQKTERLWKQKIWNDAKMIS